MSRRPFIVTQPSKNHPPKRAAPDKKRSIRALFPARWKDMTAEASGETITIVGAPRPPKPKPAPEPSGDR
jgi:hypothetical protein